MENIRYFKFKEKVDLHKYLREREVTIRKKVLFFLKDIEVDGYIIEKKSLKISLEAVTIRLLYIFMYVCVCVPDILYIIIFLSIIKCNSMLEIDLAPVLNHDVNILIWYKKTNRNEIVLLFRPTSAPCQMRVPRK